jgi:CheY-like chemotaxis protein
MYGISAVERMTGVSAATIREWQDRYGIAAPVRGPSGEQLYSRDDIEKLLEFTRRLGDAPAEPSDPPAQAPPEPGGTKRLLVLLAERDPYAAELSEYFLRTEGYAVEAVFDVAEAERRFAEAQPDLAIVELLIDGGAGLELCRRLRASRSCPMIAVSALDPGDHAELPADALLRKPLNPLELVSTVKDLLGTSALVTRGRA